MSDFLRYKAFYNSIPQDQNGTENYDMYKFWKLRGEPKHWQDAINKGDVDFDYTDGYYHFSSLGYDEENDEYHFLKKKGHPTLHYEFDWLNSNDPEAVEFRNNYHYDSDQHKYIRHSPYKPTNKEINYLTLFK